MAGYLVLADGSRVAVRDGLTLGRVAQCDIVLRDTKASRQHARLVIEGSVVELEDLNSSNGTYLNDKLIKRRLLRDGDQIRIGMTTVTFVAAAAEPTQVEAEEIELAPPSVSTEKIAPRPGASPPPLDPYRPGGGLEGDPLVGQESPPDDVEVLEFVDEVVTVKKREPAPSPVVSKSPSVQRTESQGREHGVLSFSKRATRRGMLDDDMRQMSVTHRVLVIVAVVVFALGLGYVVMKVVAAS